MKIVVVSSRIPYPLEKGDKLRLYHQIRSLSQTHQIHLYSLTDEEPSQSNIEHLESFCKSVHFYSLSKWKSYSRLIANIFGDLPFQVSYFLDTNVKSQIQKEITELKPDLIYCQLIRMAEFVKELPFPKCIDYMDAFSAVMQRRISKSKGLFKKLVRLEAMRVKEYEYHVYKYFDAHLIISAEDATHIFVPKKESLKVIPNGVDTEYFHFSENSPQFDLVFVGNMGYHPNIVAANQLVKDILPLIKSKNIRILIAGARPGKKIQQLRSKNVIVSGWMEDIREAYWNGKVFVAPIETGAGQQNKILEAMACGLPCITSSLVNRGIEAADVEEIMIADSNKEFALKIEQLLNDKDLKDRIVTKARKFVELKYNWVNSGNILSNFLIDAYESTKKKKSK